MSDDYFSYYILSYFDNEKVVRLSQILHVLRGKRTPSMFYLTEVNYWHHGFSIRKRIQQNDLKAILRTLFENKLIIEKGKGYVLTHKGEKISKAYFENHYFPKNINCFSNLSLYRPFWERIQLFTQVFSEYSYQNTHYFPVIKDPIHQENVRQLFRAAGENIEKLFQQWTREQKILFENIDEEEINIIVNLLTGYKRTGKTSIQVAKKIGMQEIEFDFYFRGILERLLEFIKKQRTKFPMLYQIIKQINKEFFLGLSQSTYQSYQLFEQGATISQIANRRHIKENTVKEHILEMAFILDEFPIKHFVSTTKYEYLTSQFENQEEYSFKEAVTAVEDLEFYQYRLVELERMRKYE